MKNQLILLFSLCTISSVLYSMENKEQQTPIPATSPTVAAQQQTPATETPAPAKATVTTESTAQTATTAPIATPTVQFVDRGSGLRAKAMMCLISAKNLAARLAKGLWNIVRRPRLGRYAYPTNGTRVENFRRAMEQQKEAWENANFYLYLRLWPGCLLGVSLAQRFANRYFHGNQIAYFTASAACMIPFCYYLIKRARLSEIERRQELFVLHATMAGITNQEAEEAYNPIENHEVAVRWNDWYDKGMGNFAIRSMKNEILRNNRDLHREHPAASGQAVTPPDETSTGQQPSRLKKAIRAIRSFPGKVARASWHILWDHEETSIWRRFWGQAPELPAVDEQVETHDHNQQINALQRALEEQGRTYKAARNYLAKRTAIFSSLATATGSAIAYCKFGASLTTAARGLYSGALTGLISLLYLGKRAQVGEIGHRHHLAALNATVAEVTEDEATQAYRQACMTLGLNPIPETNRTFWQKIQRFGISDLAELHSIKDKVAANYRELHAEVQEPRQEDAAR